MSIAKYSSGEEKYERSFEKLYAWVKNADYKGWDVFDGLNSSLFKKSPFYKSGFMRLVWIQFFKRSPVNFREIGLVPKGYNAKGLGLFASGLTALGKLDEARRLLNELLDMRCSGYSGVSWGYNFDWQARAFYVPVGKPNMVTTVFVANALLDYLATDIAKMSQTDEGKKYISAIEGVCEFLLGELVAYENSETLCFAYIPGEDARVHNANMLGAAFLARVYGIKKDENLLNKARKAMAYSVGALNDDGSWPYGERSHHRFVDNFHTGFNLVALKDWIVFSGENEWETDLAKAYEYFRNRFWLKNGCPKYYNHSLYPIDIHCSAQGIITCLKLKEYAGQSLTLAKKIAVWAIENMQDREGFFYYQKTGCYKNRIPYIRWSQAWMFYALSRLLCQCSH
jgi:hypothetical protein